MYNIFINELYTFRKAQQPFVAGTATWLRHEKQNSFWWEKHNSSDGKNTTIIHRGLL
jgi:hypothetical protein